MSSDLELVRTGSAVVNAIALAIHDAEHPMQAGDRPCRRHREQAAIAADIAETHANDELKQLREDALTVLTVYDAHTPPENRGPWRDRLMEWACRDGRGEPLLVLREQERDENHYPGWQRDQAILGGDPSL